MSNASGERAPLLSAGDEAARPAELLAAAVVAAVVAGLPLLGGRGGRCGGGGGLKGGGGDGGASRMGAGAAAAFGKSYNEVSGLTFPSSPSAPFSCRPFLLS